MTASAAAGTGAGAVDPLLKAFRSENGCGAVASRKLTDADLERLDAASARRGVRGHTSPKRLLAEENLLQAHCEWLHQEHHLNLIGVVTFSDQNAASRGIYTLDRALDDVWRGLTIGMRYPWKFVLAGEHHRTGRTVPHVHLALEAPPHATERVCRDLWHYFLNTSGRSKFEPMRDVTAATLYGLKDTVKSTKEDSSSLRMRLWHPKRCGTR